MRAVIRRDSFKIEFSGRGEVWNELLRPYLGGPIAPPEPVLASPPRAQPATPSVTRSAVPAPVPGVVTAARPAAAPAVAHAAPSSAGTDAAGRPASSQPRTWYPPRPATPQRFEPRYPTALEASGEDDDTVKVEPSSDPATLYKRLAEIPGRRSERDAVLAAAWFLTKGKRETTADEVEAHFDAFQVFPDIKVVPHLLKHVHRTKMFEQGSSQKAVTFSKKGEASVRGRLIPD